MTLWKLLSFLVVGSGLGVVLAWGQAAQSPDDGSAKIVRSGDYQPLGVLLMLKLGTAYYVNPQLARSASVTYLYSFDDLVHSGQTEHLVRSLIDGEAAVATAEAGGKYKVVQLDWGGGSNPNAQMVLKSIRATFGTTQIQVVSTRPDFLGAKPVDSLVSFDAPPVVDGPAVKLGEGTRFMSPATAAWVR